MFGKISFSARQPARHNMESRLVLCPRRDPFQCFAREIDLAEPERGRGKVKLAVDVVGLQTRDLRPPGNCFLRVLFFGGFGQDVKSGK